MHDGRGRILLESSIVVFVRFFVNKALAYVSDSAGTKVRLLHGLQIDLEIGLSNIVSIVIYSGYNIRRANARNYSLHAFSSLHQPLADPETTDGDRFKR